MTVSHGAVGDGFLPCGRCVLVQVLCVQGLAEGGMQDCSLLRRVMRYQQGLHRGEGLSLRWRDVWGLCWIKRWMGSPLRDIAEVHDFWQQEKCSSSLLRPEGRELVSSTNSHGRGTDAAEESFRASCAQLEHPQ